MAEGSPTFGSNILFKQALVDPFGHLYRAAEFGPEGLGRRVWLRVFDGPSVPTREVFESFAEASGIADVLRATNIASGVVFFEHEGTPAVSCDYLPAQPLTSVFDTARREQFPVPVDNALLVMEKLALALSAALATEIDGNPLVHGFLHPGLVLLSTDGEAMVTGFGVAEKLLEMVEQTDIADALHPYLAPEILLTRTPSRRGDVYSMGAILFQLLTGQPLPTRAEDRTSVLDDAQLAYDERPIPDDIRAVLSRTIATHPEERYSSSADFKKELDRLLYGGAYSPTTFNLALFMDRLFRSEIEAEERDRIDEDAVDVSRYLGGQPEAEVEELSLQPHRRRGLWIGVAAAALVIAAATVGWWAATRPPPGPPPDPTPTAEEETALRLEQERRLQVMVQQMVQDKMAERESEIREELVARQQRIEELQRRLRASERDSRQRQLTAEEQRKKDELQQQIAAEEEAQRQVEAELEEERQQQPTDEPDAAAAATTDSESVNAPVAADTGVTATPKPTVPSPTRSPEPAPPTVITLAENAFVEPSDVDSLPTVLKDHPVAWPRLAVHSRRRGVVIVQATVNANGRVEDVKVLRTDHEGFGIPQAVVEAVRRYHFKPATKNGTRVKSYATVTKRYEFRDR